jgi:class 3 adenylate cyclase
MSISALHIQPVTSRTIRATVLFVDLRGYTALAEQLAPARVVELLEELFGVLVRAAQDNGGEIFHVAGDGLMAGFGVRDPEHSGAREALAAAQAMLQEFAPIAERWSKELSVQTGIGIGLHEGDVAFGYLGSLATRAPMPTLVGDTVNVAARLCARARAGEVLFSAVIAASLEADGGEVSGGAGLSQAALLHLPSYALRGRRAPLDIWCVPAVDRLPV